MRRYILMIAMAACTLVACKSMEDADDIEAWKVAPADPIMAVGHGAILDAEGRRFDLTPGAVVDAQRYYLKRLYQQADRRERAEFKQRQRRLQELGAQTRAERILLNAALLAWLIETVQPLDAPYLASKNTALLDRYVGALDSGESPDKGAGAVRKDLIEHLHRDGSLKFLSTLAGGQAYIDECRQAGVPIPPDWGSPQWVSQGLLTVDFLGSTPQAEVFAFESGAPRGVCMALPRSSGNTISLLGVICLGTETSKSCFWDNQRNKKQFPIQKGTPVSLSSFAGGADLFGGTGGVCTDCHAGENPYVVHPGQPMDLDGKIIPKAWQQPLIHPSWPQNPGPTTVLQTITLGPGEDSCAACHSRPPGVRFPEVSTALPQYCSLILPTAIARTMPPTSPGSNATYAKHKAALQAACKQPPPTGVVINGATQSEPTSSRSQSGGDLSACAPGGDCPLGFCYWKTLHGPFWQTTPSTVPVGDAAYRGSFVRIYAEAGRWKWLALVDPTGGPPKAPPGGTAECVAYRDVAAVPDPNNCFANMFSVTDPDGTQTFQSTNATVTGAASANVLSGFIGNVAQANFDRPDSLRVTDNSGAVALMQTHVLNPPPPLKPGPLTGESWTNGCSGWTPIYDAKEVQSTSDVQLVPAAQASKVRCYITGITGAWSSTRSNGAVQPFAQIYTGSGGEIRLKVSPPGENDRVSAFASCIRLK